jgi:D-arabinose 1-dehydrogenase-like Zn-dependent alcohol dehydrogenase
MLFSLVEARCKCQAFLQTQSNFCPILRGNRQEALDMLKLAAEKGIHPWIQLLPSAYSAKELSFQ